MCLLTIPSGSIRDNGSIIRAWHPHGMVPKSLNKHRTFALWSTRSPLWPGPLVQTALQTSSIGAGSNIPASRRNKRWMGLEGCDSSRRSPTRAGNIPGSSEFRTAIRSGRHGYRCQRKVLRSSERLKRSRMEDFHVQSVVGNRQCKRFGPQHR